MRMITLKREKRFLRSYQSNNMQPELAQKLMKNKDIVDFVDFLTKKVGELDTITDIDFDKPEIELDKDKMIIEVRARKLANTKLKEILAPLLNSREERGEINKQEYIT